MVELVIPKVTERKKEKKRMKGQKNEWIGKGSLKEEGRDS